MPPSLYGFQDRETAVVLSRFVKSGAINSVLPQVEAYPVPNKIIHEIWWATAKTEVSAATQGTAGTDFLVGTGTVYLLRLDTTLSNPTLLKEEMNDGTWNEKTIYNPFDSVIKVGTGIVFPVVKDRHGLFWVLEPVKMKDKCRFTLDSALATSDTYKDATIEEQWGYGFDHPSTDIDVYNLKTHTSGTFEFYGDAGDYGRASYDPQSDKWWIDILECPTS